jgi:membrane protease YdiL (CAAX protease family)
LKFYRAFVRVKNKNQKSRNNPLSKLPAFLCLLITIAFAAWAAAAFLPSDALAQAPPSDESGIAEKHIQKQRDLNQNWSLLKGEFGPAAFAALGIVLLGIALILAAGYFLGRRLYLRYAKFPPQNPAIGFKTIVVVLSCFIVFRLAVYLFVGFVRPVPGDEFSPDTMMFRDQISYFISVLMIAALIVYGIYLRRKLALSEYGFRRVSKFRSLALPVIGFGIIFAFDFVYVYIMQHFGLMEEIKGFQGGYFPAEQGPAFAAVTLLNMLILAPVVEEILFRSFMYHGFEEYLGPIAAIILSSLLFAISHDSKILIIPYFFNGVILALLYYYCRSLVPCMLAHFLNNFVFFARHIVIQ